MTSPFRPRRQPRIERSLYDGRLATLSDFLTEGRPWECLQRRMEALGLDAAALAERSGLPLETIAGVLAGERPIGYATALGLARATESDAGYWIMVQSIEDARRAVRGL